MKMSELEPTSTPEKTPEQLSQDRRKWQGVNETAQLPVFDKEVAHSMALAGDEHETDIVSAKDALRIITAAMVEDAHRMTDESRNNINASVSNLFDKVKESRSLADVAEAKTESIIREAHDIAESVESIK